MVSFHSYVSLPEGIMNTGDSYGFNWPLLWDMEWDLRIEHDFTSEKVIAVIAVPITLW